MGKIVYVLTNPAMPNLVKIGVTTRKQVKSRIAELGRGTGVPVPFDCHYAGEVSGHQGNVEKLVHELFKGSRLNPKREFFSIEPDQAVVALKLANAKEVTPEFKVKHDPEETKAIRIVERQKRTKTDLKEIGIPVGATLTLSRGHSIKCKVVVGNKVRFEGQTMSSSAAALLALHKLGFKTPAVSGPGYWMFKGKTIGQIRREKEKGV